MCIVMGITATALGTLVSGKVRDFFGVVKRELGPNWSSFMGLLGGLITTLVTCIVFLLCSDILYETLETFSGMLCIYY